MSDDPIYVHSVGARIEHYGQHGSACFACKLKTIRFGTHITSRPTHIKNGSHWDGNPVKDRIEELQAQGRRVTAMEMNNPATTKEN